MSGRYVKSADHGEAARDACPLALALLARLVRDEFPAERSLIEIADIWGNATPAELEALRAVEPMLG
jgi:hypothetical protein